MSNCLQKIAKCKNRVYYIVAIFCYPASQEFIQKGYNFVTQKNTWSLTWKQSKEVEGDLKALVKKNQHTAKDLDSKSH